MEQQPTNPLEQQTATMILEQNLLGAILMDPTLMAEAESTLRKEMFGHPYHRNLYRMLVTLLNDGMAIEPVNITSRFEKHLDKIGGLQYLAQIMNHTYTTGHFTEHVHRLIEGHARAKVLQLLEEFRPRFEDPAQGTFEELLDEFERMTLEIRPVKNQRETGVQSVIGWYENLVRKSEDRSLAFGMMTGWSDLDRMTLGFQRKDMIVVGARTSMGKSAFALAIARRVSKRGWKVAIFSLEMIKDQIYNRLMSEMATVTMQSIRVGNVSEGQLAAISARLDEISQIYIDDERGITAEYITSEMRRLKRQEGLDLVIIDYLQEIKEPAERNDNTGSALHRVSQKIRTAAKECDCAVIGLSQVKREVEQRANKRPMTSDLSGSAALEAVADTIILLYQDEYYNTDTSDVGVLEVNVAKQRNGPTGMIKMKYNKDYQRITGRGDDDGGPHQESLALV